MSTLVSHTTDTTLMVGASQSPLRLSAMKVAFAPDSGTLFVADVHIGKASSFRSLGVPVPSGTTSSTLDRLSQALEAFQATHLVILGDFIHARNGKSSDVMNALHAWRERWADVSMTLVEGNHDRFSGLLPSSLRIEVVEEPHRIGPVTACHVPQLIEGTYVLAGHVHPAVVLSGKGRDRLRLPCFWEQAGQLLTLPAFGDFTGMYTISPDKKDRVWPVSGDPEAL